MSKKVTQEQIKKLFAFCRKHYVQHYDLQIELVHHLASSIEEKWEDNPQLPFEKALNDVFGDFGIYGFSKVKEAKTKGLQKKYMKLLWKYILEFYGLPKIILTIALSLSIFTAFQWFADNSAVGNVLTIAYLLFILYYILFIYPKKYKLDLVPGKSFLLYDQLKSIQSTSYLIAIFPLNMFNIFRSLIIKAQFLNSYVFEALISFVISFFIILMAGMLFYWPQRIKDDFMNEFPQFVKN